jgi:hypothetical protein
MFGAASRHPQDVQLSLQRQLLLVEKLGLITCSPGPSGLQGNKHQAEIGEHVMAESLVVDNV